jgi:hypothetical protein
MPSSSNKRSSSTDKASRLDGSDNVALQLHTLIEQLESTDARMRGIGAQLDEMKTLILSKRNTIQDPEGKIHTAGENSSVSGQNDCANQRLHRLIQGVPEVQNILRGHDEGRGPQEPAEKIVAPLRKQ